MTKIGNFGDIFPPRELGEANPWGRHIESRIEGVEKEIVQYTQNTSSSGRIQEARAQVLSNQIVRLNSQQGELEFQQGVLSAQQQALSNHQALLNSQQAELAAQQSDLANQQQSLTNQQTLLTQLVNSMPRNSGGQARNTNWSINTAPTNGAWTTVSSVTVTVPAGNLNRVAVTAWGNASATSSNVYESAMQARIVIAGTGSSAFEGTIETLAATVRSTVNASYFREFAVSGNVQVTLQVRGRYNSFPATNVSNLTVSAGFTQVGL